MKIKQSQIFGWDEEPVEERPSEFASTAGHSILSGYHSACVSATPPRHSQAHTGWVGVLLFCVVLFGLGVYGLVRFAPLLRA